MKKREKKKEHMWNYYVDKTTDNILVYFFQKQISLELYGIILHILLYELFFIHLKILHRNSEYFLMSNTVV